jgi:hypothetical protein
MDRISAHGARELLEQAHSAIAAGNVNIVSVLAIRQRSGERWSRKRQQVEDFLLRAFARAASPHDTMVPLNEVEFLAFQPEASKAAALTLSANVLKETLTFFLGAAAQADVAVFRVTGFSGEEISVERIDPATLAAAEAEPAPEAPSAVGAGAPPAAPIRTDALKREVRLVAENRPPLVLSLGIEPTWNVAARVVTSFLVRARIAAEDGAAAADAAPSQAGEAALKTLAYANELLTSGPEALQVGLHVPLSLEALAHSGSRYRLLHALRALDAALRRRLILEIVDLPGGFPQSRLTELASVLAPYGRAVLARAPSETANLFPWRRCGLGGISLDCGDLKPSDRNAQARLERFAAAAAAAAPACVAYSLASRSLLMAAWAAGFTHLGGAAVDAEVSTPSAQRFDPVRFYVRSAARRSRRSAA